MTYEKAYNLIKSLSMSQGFYGRLLERLDEDADAQDALASWCESHSDADDVNLIMAIEG